MFISGLTFILIPYSTHLWQIYLLVWISFFGAGATDIGNQVWLIEMWQKKCGPFLQMSGFAYGVGIILGPLIDKPYLSGHNANITSPERREGMREELKIPFLISGVVTLIGLFLLKTILHLNIF